MREYRAYFHIGKSYDFSESIDTIIKHLAFALPGRKGLINDNYDAKFLIDATKTHIECLKKAEEVLFWKREGA